MFYKLLGLFLTFQRKLDSLRWWNLYVDVEFDNVTFWWDINYSLLVVDISKHSDPLTFIKTPVYQRSRILGLLLPRTGSHSRLGTLSKAPIFALERLRLTSTGETPRRVPGQVYFLQKGVCEIRDTKNPPVGVSITLTR